MGGRTTSPRSPSPSPSAARCEGYDSCQTPEYQNTRIPDHQDTITPELQNTRSTELQETTWRSGSSLAELGNILTENGNFLKLIWSEHQKIVHRTTSLVHKISQLCTFKSDVSE